MDALACYIFGAGSFYGLRGRPMEGDYVIAADGGWLACQKAGVTPDLLLGDFDSLGENPAFPNTERFPVEKDDTDMMLAIKHGLSLGHREFHIYGGLGGRRSDHSVANLQALAYLAHHGAQGWLYGDGERFTAIYNSHIDFPAQPEGILSVFCWGGDAKGVAIRGAHYPLEDAVLTADLPLGVSNHFCGKDVTVSVQQGCLVLCLRGEE